MLLAIIQQPDAPTHYRKLQAAYNSKGMTYEAEAIGHLIEKKFGKKDERISNSPVNQE